MRAKAEVKRLEEASTYSGVVGFADDPCPMADECVVSAIEKDLAVLSAPSATEQEKLEALKYLGHWVGDVHQPLHVSFQDDRGGNGIDVSGGVCSRDLHAVWDRCIIEEGLPGDAYSIARELLAPIREGPSHVVGLNHRSIGRASPSRSRSVRRSGTASAPARAAGTSRTTSAWTRASRRGRWSSTGSTSRPMPRPFGSSWSRPGSGSLAC